MQATSNVYRFNNSYPYDNWETTKDGKLIGYYPRNSLINLSSQIKSGIGVYPNNCVIRNNVRVICRNCFRNNKRFGLITITEGVERIEEYAFYNVRVKEIGLPRTLKSIRKNSFSKDMLLYVYKDSYAERYAIKNGYRYEYYDESK